MRILTCLYTMEVGGSQINAIEIGAVVARQGHEVIIYGPDGDLRGMASDLGLEFVEGPARERPHLSAQATRQIGRLVVQRRIDLVHAYESAPTMDVAYGTHLWRGVPLVMTVMSMSVSKFLPTHLPLVVGTAEIAEGERPRRRWVELIEPPVDTAANAPVDDNAAARARFGLAAADCALVSVSRLVPSLKLEGVLAAISTVGLIGDESPQVRYLVVGDGESRREVERLAAQTNTALGREAVTVVGQMPDPRDAYAASDVMLGMGGSALRALAFAKPLVVQGEHGFWELLTPDTLEVFLRQGWYGVGDGRDGAPKLAGLLRGLVADPQRRVSLGRFGREVVTANFSLDVAAKRQIDIYSGALANRPGFGRRAVAMAETSVHYAWFRAVWLRRMLGKAPRRAEAGAH